MASTRRDTRRSVRVRTTRTWLLRGFAAAVLAGAFAYLPFHLYKKSGFEKLIGLRRDLATLQASNQTLRVQIDRLAREADRLQNDAREVEKVARHEIGWVHLGDIVVDVEGGLP